MKYRTTVEDWVDSDIEDEEPSSGRRLVDLLYMHIPFVIFFQNFRGRCSGEQL